MGSRSKGFEKTVYRHETTKPEDLKLDYSASGADDPFSDEDEDKYYNFFLSRQEMKSIHEKEVLEFKQLK